MKQYDYSVKEVLTSAFGENTVFEMRRQHESVFDSAEPGMLVALCWQYADEQVLYRFLANKYLADTVLTDDCVAYIVRKNDTQYAYLMFMLTEEDVPFRINMAYTVSVLDDWKAKGFEPRILSECIDVKPYDKSGTRFQFKRHAGKEMLSAAYSLRSGNEKAILVSEIHPCRTEYDKKLVSVFASHQLIEYECLFEPDVEIMKGAGREMSVLSKGISAVKELFEANAPVYSGYSEFTDSGVYFSATFAGEREIAYTFSRRNLISKINLAPQIPIISFLRDRTTCTA